MAEPSGPGPLARPSGPGRSGERSRRGGPEVRGAPTGQASRQEASVEFHQHGGDWLQDVVFGLNDGLVTTLVFVIAVSGVAASRIVLVALGEVIAGGVSMTLGGFLASRTAREVLEQRIATEQLEIRSEPDEERGELREIYHAKGLRGELLERVIAHLTSDEERWLETMIRDEHGIVSRQWQNPLTRGGLVGSAFALGGLVPVIPFALHLHHAQWLAFGLTALVALGLGALKSRYTLKRPLRGALEFVAIVTAGTIVGVAIGVVLRHV
jgi:VIT1/CCC1 family predicted Fe2+/Mn2+ transporter